MTTQEKMGLYRDDMVRWLTNRRDHPIYPHVKPNPKAYGLDDDWVIKQVEEQAEQIFNKNNQKEKQ